MFKYLALWLALGLTACNNAHLPTSTTTANTSSGCLSLNIADCAVVHSPVNH